MADTRLEDLTDIATASGLQATDIIYINRPGTDADYKGDADDIVTYVMNNIPNDTITVAMIDVSADVKSLLDDADFSAMRTSLGLGTGDSPQFAAINVGHASNTTITQVSAGLIAVEGDTVILAGATQELDNKTLDSSVGKGTWTASGTWTLPSFTMGGNIQMLENVSVGLVTTLSADGKYCGITEAGTAGATLAFGDLVYLSASDSRWELTDADAEATAGPVKIGICVLAAAADGDPTTILLWGKVRADAAFPTFTVGAPVYISTTAGDVQVAQPSGTDDVIRIVGYGNTGDVLFFCPSTEYLTHT